ncbi:hypothetical protein DFR42_102102 [Undibacterium pigrum]|uniref:Uncharacterized protein n=1 Tax=Undibacterium pigrum TaxID=401470 RepID=A0A318JD67_9BURK|nr:hypothetical protein DFR42_102102 [Undibacterium pigrum]
MASLASWSRSTLALIMAWQRYSAGSAISSMKLERCTSGKSWKFVSHAREGSAGSAVLDLFSQSSIIWFVLQTSFR